MGQMRKETIQSADIDTAIRFCRIEHHYGICQHKLTSAEIDQLRKWNNIIIDNHALLKDALCSYKQHWDSVLNSYIRISAKRKRLQYLIDDLEEIRTLHELQAFSDIIESIDSLQEEYTSQLKAL